MPSILGVDLLKHLGATLQYSDAGDACTWINDSGERVVIPMHCTAAEISGEFSLTVAEGTLLQPSGEVGDKAVTYAYVDIAPENVRCNQQFYCTPDIVHSHNRSWQQHHWQRLSRSTAHYLYAHQHTHTDTETDQR